jgi:uncharacterized protein YjdB
MEQSQEPCSFLSVNAEVHTNEGSFTSVCTDGVKHRTKAPMEVIHMGITEEENNGGNTSQKVHATPKTKTTSSRRKKLKGMVIHHTHVLSCFPTLNVKKTIINYAVNINLVDLAWLIYEA